MADQPAEKQPRRRPRRATRPAMAPTDDAPASQGSASSDSDVSNLATESAVPTSKASSPKSAAPKSSTTDSSGEGEAPAKKPSRRASSSRKAAAKSADVSSSTGKPAPSGGQSDSAESPNDGETQQQSDTDSKADNGSAPTKKAGSKAKASGGRRKASPVKQNEDAANSTPDQVERDVTLDVRAELADARRPGGTASQGSARAASIDIDIPDRRDSQSTAAAESDVRLPATALLFQPPDLPSRTNGRRAQKSDEQSSREDVSAAEGNSSHQDNQKTESKRTKKASGSSSRGKAQAKGESNAKSDSPVADATLNGDTSSGPETNEAANESSESGPKRRRRGGRGRRRSGNESDVAEAGDTETDTAPQEPSEGPGQGSQKNSGQQSNARKKKSNDANNGGQSGGQNDESGHAKKSSQKNSADSGSSQSEQDSSDDKAGDESGSSRRRRRRRSRGSGGSGGSASDQRNSDVKDEVTALKGSTRLEAKRQRRRDGRDAGRRRTVITEAEFLARRESVERTMVVRDLDGRTQIAVLEDGVLVEHYVARKSQSSMVGNVYLGRVQNVLPSMEAAFVDLGRGRNAVLYAGEVNWDAAGLEGGQPRRIEQALSSGDSVLVQVTKDPIGHKGARLTSQITLAGRYLVLVPSGAMTGISRKLPENERSRLKSLLKEIVPEGQGVIVRTAAEGASETELRRDVERLTKQWGEIQKKSERPSTNAPALLKGEPELATRVVRDIFNEDFKKLIISGAESYKTISEYLGTVAPDLVERLEHWSDSRDVFSEHRIDEQLAKGMDRKVWLPSGGSLVIDRTEAMTVVDVNTGKFTGSGGTLEETVTRNNLEAAEEIVRQLRLRDIGGIIVIDFIDMVLESNRDLVLRRLVECLGRDRTRHQVAEVTSLGLVQMTRKRVGQGLVEAFSHACEHCNGRGFIVETNPASSGQSRGSGHDHQHVAGNDKQEKKAEESPAADSRGASQRGESESTGRGRGRRGRGASKPKEEPAVVIPSLDAGQREEVKATLAAIAAAAAHAHEPDEGAPVAEPENVTEGHEPDVAAVSPEVHQESLDGESVPQTSAQDDGVPPEVGSEIEAEEQSGNADGDPGDLHDFTAATSANEDGDQEVTADS